MIRDVLYTCHSLVFCYNTYLKLNFAFVLWFCYQNVWKCFWITLYFLCLHLLGRLWRFAHSYFSDLWTRELWCNRQIRQNQEFRNVLHQFGPDDFNKHSVPLLKKNITIVILFPKIIFYVNDKNTLKYAYILLRRKTLVM